MQWLSRCYCHFANEKTEVKVTPTASEQWSASSWGKISACIFHNLPSVETINIFSLLPHRWCCRRLFRVPWTARRSNQSILKESIPEYSLEGLMLKLKLQYFGHLMWRADSFEKTLMLGKIEGRRRRGWRGWDSWMASPAQWTWVQVDFGSWWWTGRPGVMHFTGLQIDTTEWLIWTELNGTYRKIPPLCSRKK